VSTRPTRPNRPNRPPNPRATAAARDKAAPDKAAPDKAAPARKRAEPAAPEPKAGWIKASRAAARAKAAKPAGPPPAIGADQLEKTYGDLPALAPLDLAITDGEAVALVGHNGSGKTTFLRMAAGLLEPTGGTATVHGHAAGSLPARAALSFLPDNPTFYDDLSVWEHLEYVARLHGMDDAWEQRAADLLGHFGIYERGDDLPSRFSRGLRQKAQLALGLLRPFAVLCIDEPFVGLDAAGKQALLELIDEAHGSGATLVVATHDLDFVQRPTVTRCIALRDGVVVHDGPPGDIDVLALVS
jgi:ABC-2 type transport system ATP-binding protein